MTLSRREALAALVALPAVKEIEVASVRPQDVIVIECDAFINEETAEYIRQRALLVWPDRKIVVLGEGMSVKVLREAT